MESFWESVNVLFFLALVPGFIAAKVRDWITERSVNTTLANDAIRALLYWIPIFSILWLLSKLKFTNITAFPLNGDFKVSTFIAAMLIAVLVGLFAGVMGETRIAQRIASRLRISRKTWKTPWASAFWDAENQDSNPCWAMVWLKDGTRLMGFAKYYSDSGKDATIYLARDPKYSQNVRIMHPGMKNMTDIPGIGVLIPPSAEISHVDFLPGQAFPEDSDTQEEDPAVDY